MIFNSLTTMLENWVKGGYTRTRYGLQAVDGMLQEIHGETTKARELLCLRVALVVVSLIEPNSEAKDRRRPLSAAVPVKYLYLTVSRYFRVRDSPGITTQRAMFSPGIHLRQPELRIVVTSCTTRMA